MFHLRRNQRILRDFSAEHHEVRRGYPLRFVRQRHVVRWHDGVPHDGERMSPATRGVTWFIDVSTVGVLAHEPRRWVLGVALDDRTGVCHPFSNVAIALLPQ